MFIFATDYFCSNEYTVCDNVHICIQCVHISIAFELKEHRLLSSSMHGPAQRAVKMARSYEMVKYIGRDIGSDISYPYCPRPYLHPWYLPMNP